MKTTIRLFVAFFAAAVFCACSSEGVSQYHITIQPYLLSDSRVTNTDFESGDRIGLTIKGSSQVYAENRQMDYNGVMFVGASPLLWYTNADQEATLIAYYPYRSEGAPAELTLDSDQNSTYEQNDLLVSVRSHVKPAADPVAMNFSHLFSRIDISIDNRTAASVERVTLGHFVPTASIDLEQMTARAKAGAANTAVVTPQTVRAGSSYRAIVVPQTADITATVRTSSGKEYSTTVLNATLAAHTRYAMNITLNESSISVSLSGSITDWTDGGSLGSSSGSASGQPGAAEGKLVYEGETYVTRVFDGLEWMAENLRYMPAGASLGEGVWEPESGAVSELGLLYNYTTATKGRTGTEEDDGTNVQGICPAGWHLPSREELASLQANAPADFYTASGFMNVAISAMGANKYDASKSALMGATPAAAVASQPMVYCLDIQTSGGVNSVSLNQKYAGHGISVRCLRKAQ